jgi:hypothetical protein
VRVLPALPSAVFAEREYLIAAWSRYVTRDVLETLNVVSFGLYEDVEGNLTARTVRMRWNLDQRVGEDIEVPRSLVERTEHLWKSRATTAESACTITTQFGPLVPSRPVR